MLHVYQSKKSGMRENRFLCGLQQTLSTENLESFDTVRVPKYYKQIKESINYYFHCQGLKSDINLIHGFTILDGENYIIATTLMKFLEN